MGRGTATERAILDIVELRRARGLISDDEARDDVDEVIERRREDAGESVPKAVASRLLGVSRQTLDKWIGRGLLPTVEADNGWARIPREPLEELVEQVSALRRLGANRAVLSEAISRLSQEPSAMRRMLDPDLVKSLKQVQRGKLGKVTLPEGWGPED